MELRGQENNIRTPVPSRDGNNHNGTTVLTYTQTLDHHHHHRHNRSPTGSNSKSSSNHVRYRECLRNHAASVGGNVYDGCGEFMPGGEEGSLEALKCAACDCHRNFHRKEVDGETQLSSRRSSMTLQSLQLPPPLPSPSAVMHHQRYSNIIQPMSVAFGGGGGGGGGGGTESSSEDLNAFQSNAEGVPHPPPYVLLKKRFRTKFTPEQKDRMMEFAEKVGWRINKQDDEEVDKFCAEVGVRRQVFKVWMHNNKNLKKQEQQQQPPQENQPM